MMFRSLRVALTLLAVCGMAIGFSSPALAASPNTTAQTAKMTVQVDVTAAPVFWKYTFLTRDGDMAMPANVKISWGIGDNSRGNNRQIVVEQGKNSGKVAIVTEKNALVDMQIQVYSAKNVVLGSYNLFVRNNGQTEVITITPPEYTEPTFTWGG